MAKGGRDRMTADDERRFFSLLRAGLWDKDVELCLFGSPVDWQSLLEQGRKQTVLGVLADGIGKLPPALRPPFPIHRSLQQELLHIRQGHILLNHVLQEIWEKLACAGIRPVLLKGQGMAQYYVCPEQRQCGDIDLYVGPEQYDHACQVLKKYGKPTGEENESSKHRHFHRNGVIIEIHRLAGTFSDPLTNKRFQRLTRTYLHEDGYCFEKLKGTDVSLPPVNFDALFLFFHMVGHFIHGGVGLRQVCDWALFLSARSADIDKERLSREIRFLHMEKFWRLFGGIAVDYLGLSGNSFPDFFFTGKKEMRRAMNLILETGNFGHYFFDLSLRPKNYYGGKLYGFYCRVRWQREVFSFAPWMLLRGGLVDFWGSIKTVLTHK